MNKLINYLPPAVPWWWWRRACRGRRGQPPPSTFRPTPIATPSDLGFHALHLTDTERERDLLVVDQKEKRGGEDSVLGFNSAWVGPAHHLWQPTAYNILYPKKKKKKKTSNSNRKRGNHRTLAMSAAWMLRRAVSQRLLRHRSRSLCSSLSSSSSGKVSVTFILLPFLFMFLAIDRRFQEYQIIPLSSPLLAPSSLFFSLLFVIYTEYSYQLV